MATQCNQSQFLTSLNKFCAHNPSTSRDNQAKLSNSLASPCPRDPGEYVLKKSTAVQRDQDSPGTWFKFVYPSYNPRTTKTSTCTPVHVVCSPLASMNHWWTINLHDAYPSFNVLMLVEYISPSIPTLCNLLSPMFHFGVDYLHPAKGHQHDLPSIAPPKGKMTKVFSVGLDFSRVPHQELHVWVTLRFPGSIK